jgi:hypothetical protein
MKQIHHVGFRELDKDQSLPSLRESIGKGRYDDHAQIGSYLRRGVHWVICMGLANDVLASSPKRIGGRSLMTDGEWSWREDIAYYFDAYKIALPEAFVRHIRWRRYQPPPEQCLEFMPRSAPVDPPRIQLPDGSLSFGQLPKSWPRERVRDHALLLPGAVLTDFVPRRPAPACIRFTCQGHAFAINDDFNAFTLFAKDPDSAGALLHEVRSHFNRLK